MSIERLCAIVCAPPAEWTNARSLELAALVRGALSAYRTVLFEAPCATQSEAVAWGLVAQGIVGTNADLIHTGGANWDGAIVRWNFSAWPKRASSERVLGRHTQRLAAPAGKGRGNVATSVVELPAAVGEAAPAVKNIVLYRGSIPTLRFIMATPGSIVGIGRATLTLSVRRGDLDPVFQREGVISASGGLSGSGQPTCGSWDVPFTQAETLALTVQKYAFSFDTEHGPLTLGQVSVK